MFSESEESSFTLRIPAGLLRLHSSFRHDFKSLDFFVEAFLKIFLDKVQIKLVCSTKRDAIDRKHCA